MIGKHQSVVAAGDKGCCLIIASDQKTDAAEHFYSSKVQAHAVQAVSRELWSREDTRLPLKESD